MTSRKNFDKSFIRRRKPAFVSSDDENQPSEQTSFKPSAQLRPQRSVRFSPIISSDDFTDEQIPVYSKDKSILHSLNSAFSNMKVLIDRRHPHQEDTETESTHHPEVTVIVPEPLATGPVLRMNRAVSTHGPKRDVAVGPANDALESAREATASITVPEGLGDAAIRDPHILMAACMHVDEESRRALLHGTLRLHVLRLDVEKLPPEASRGVFVEVAVDSVRVAKSRVLTLHGSQDPVNLDPHLVGERRGLLVWFEEAEMELHGMYEVITISVKAKKTFVVAPRTLGVVSIHAADLVAVLEGAKRQLGQTQPQAVPGDAPRSGAITALRGQGVAVAADFPLVPTTATGRPRLEELSSGRPSAVAAMRLLIRFIPALAALFRPPAVPRAPVPPSDRNMVTFYQDPHVGDGTAAQLGALLLSTGAMRRSQNLWETLHLDILTAQHFVYYMGPEMDVTVLLQRTPLSKDVADRVPLDAPVLPIGELLRFRALRGVRTAVLSTGRVTRSGSGGIVAKARDVVRLVVGSKEKDSEEPQADRAQDPASYFAGTPVTFRFIRDPKSTEDPEPFEFMIICDCAVEVPPQASPSGVAQRDERRGLVAYVGTAVGLVRGWWDAPLHPLFATLISNHKGDFANRAAPDVDPRIGPRQPIHSTAVRIVGPAAMDVLRHFEERWIAANRGPPEDACVGLVSHGDLDLLVLSRKELAQAAQRQCEAHGAAQATVQTVRTMPRSILHTPNPDTSLHAAMVHTVRRSGRFLYLELPQCQAARNVWRSETPDITNYVCVEIALHIAEAIYSNRPFAVYIVLPMFPLGDPVEKPQQEATGWQFQTIAMMYAIVAKAIGDAGLSTHPQRFLNFFALVAREHGVGIDLEYARSASRSERQELLLRTRRFPIHCASSLLIADDTTAIISHGGISERALGGETGTDFGVVVWQPSEMHQARGEVWAFRRHLWAEHLGINAPEFDAPETLPCVKAVSRIAETHWTQFMADRANLMRGHIVPFPIIVSADGTIAPRLKNYPDTKAPVEGEEALFLPEILTQ